VALLDYQQLLASHDMPPCGNEGQTCRCEADVWETERMVHGFLLVGRNPENPGDRSTLGDYRSGKSRGRGKARFCERQFAPKCPGCQGPS